jgi:DNA replication protein DnaC
MNVHWILLKKYAGRKIVFNYKDLDKFTPCRKCYKRNDHYPEGYIVETIQYTDEQCEKLGVLKGYMVQTVKMCDCRLKWEEECKLEAKMKRNGFNPVYSHYDINEDYYASQNESDKIYGISIKDWVKKYLEYFSKSERTRAAFCYFWGVNGTQKTSVAQYIGKELLSSQYKVKYLLMNDLIHLLMKTERDEEARKEIEDFDNYDLLILDESWDIQKITIYSSQFQLPFLDTFLRNRLQKRKGIIFISNISYCAINPKFGDSLRDLVEREIQKEKSGLLFTSRFADAISRIDDEGLFS